MASLPALIKGPNTFQDLLRPFVPSSSTQKLSEDSNICTEHVRFHLSFRFTAALLLKRPAPSGCGRSTLARQKSDCFLFAPYCTCAKQTTCQTRELPRSIKTQSVLIEWHRTTQQSCEQKHSLLDRFLLDSSQKDDLNKSTICVVRREKGNLEICALHFGSISTVFVDFIECTAHIALHTCGPHHAFHAPVQKTRAVLANRCPGRSTLFIARYVVTMYKVVNVQLRTYQLRGMSEFTTSGVSFGYTQLSSQFKVARFYRDKIAFCCVGIEF